MSPLAVRVSDSAGFCWGVERALQLTLEAAQDAPQPVHTLGPLIHNPGVIAELKAKGVGVLLDAASAKAGTVILRSHGVPRNVKETLTAVRPHRGRRYVPLCDFRPGEGGRAEPRWLCGDYPG